MSLVRKLGSGGFLETLQHPPPSPSSRTFSPIPPKVALHHSPEQDVFPSPLCVTTLTSCLHRYATRSDAQVRHLVLPQGRDVCVCVYVCMSVSVCVCVYVCECVCV